MIEDFGERHLRGGELIVYTSADSVLQIAAHEDVVPREELYAVCASAREIMRGEHAVGRVIARPFRGHARRLRAHRRAARPGRRAAGALLPPGAPGRRRAGACGRQGRAGVRRGRRDEQHPGATNAAAIETTNALMEGLAGGLVFANLVETDQVYGHRRDVAGLPPRAAARSTGPWAAGSSAVTSAATCWC